MNVRELMAALAAMPQDAEVTHLWDGAPRTTINHVWLARSGQVVTADDLMVCYATEDRPAYAPTDRQEPYWQSPGNAAEQEVGS